MNIGKHPIYFAGPKNMFQQWFQAGGKVGSSSCPSVLETTEVYNSVKTTKERKLWDSGGKIKDRGQVGVAWTLGMERRKRHRR